VKTLTGKEIEIDIEIEDGECRLLCANCHHEKTHCGMVPLYE